MVCRALALLVGFVGVACAAPGPESSRPDTSLPDTRRTQPAPVPDAGQLTPTVHASAAHVDSAAVARQVTDLLTESARAWNRDDLDAFLDSYVVGPSLTFVGGADVVRDRAALRQSYEDSYFSGGLEPPDLRFRDIEVRPLGEAHALAFGRWLLYSPGFEVQTIVGEGWFTLVLQRIDGQWRITHDHSSSLPSAEPSEGASGSSDPEAPAGSAPVG